MIYTVTMNPAIDYVVHLSGSLTPGAINRSAGEAYQFGGKGINVSNVLKNLGHQTVALGFVAGATGAWLEQGLAQMGLETRFLHLDHGQTRINVKIKATEETEVNGMGPVIEDAHLRRLCEALKTLSSADVLVLSGSVPACLSADTYGRILGGLETPAVKTVVDAAGKLLLEVLPYHPFLIKPNDIELSELFGMPMDSEDAILEAAARLQAKGARNVLISRGAQGALLLDETGCVHRCPAPRGQVVNSVGAGDSMVAGFLAGFLETGNYDAALSMGVAAGSATAFSLGLADRKAVMGLLEQMRSL